ncbi:MAG: carbohydrate binding family 9 domain-containing protein [Ignavibacteria bacterium]|nr:carbohydrate binding family 9 domain-containing protein [Ignavibacteria bacterium]
MKAGTSPKSIVASRVATSPRIDGYLSDDVWQSAVAVSGFQQFDPDEGAPSTEATAVKVVYDDNAVYVGVMCYDSDPLGIVGQLTRRDRTVEADRFSFNIDSYHDHTTAFVFGGSVSGVQSDGILSQDGLVYDNQWDAVWDFDSKILPDGWSAEFKIPFSALRFSEQDSEYVWGINFRRYIARKKEIDQWVMVPRKEMPPGTIASVSKMGHLSGITNIHPPLRIEVLPYQVSKVNYLAQPAPFPARKELKGSAGLDLKYGVTNSFTFDMAINPDFGQVEVDQSVLNLTVFETRYPEKRPFFLEGARLFTFGESFDNQSLQLFYSRRIGRKPTLARPPTPGYTFSQNPQTTTILGAMKLTGRTDDGFSIGALTALTDQEEAIEEDTSGVRLSPFIVEPRGSYSVVRLKQDILGNSSVGMMLTSRFKDQRFPSLSGGIDWNVRFGDGTYRADGYIAGSQITIAPDTRHTGSAGRINVGKPEGDHWLAVTEYDFASRNFFISDLGLFNQPLEHGGYAQIIYKEDHAVAPVRRYWLALEADDRWNWDGINTLKNILAQVSWEFRNFWYVGLNYYNDLPSFDDASRGLRGLYRRPSGNRLIASLQTDSRYPLFITMSGGYYNTAKNSRTVFGGAVFTIRPTPWIELAPEIFLLGTRNLEAWVIPDTTDDGHNLFGDRDVDQVNFSLRGTITFTRSLSMQFFTQVFLAKGHYSNFKKLLSADELPLYGYESSPLYANPDFNQKFLNANVVLRWEYLPGSTFYLVWTQARFGNDGIFDQSFSENFSNAFKLPMDNVVLAKISYWWNL